MRLYGNSVISLQLFSKSKSILKFLFFFNLKNQTWLGLIDTHAKNFIGGNGVMSE